MKKFLLFVLALYITDVNAQCTPTITGNTVICAGSCATLSASGGITYTWVPGGITTSTISVCPSSTTTYTLIAVTGACTATETVMVVVNPLPNVTISAGNTTICMGSTTTCFTAMGAITYSWAPTFGLMCSSCGSTCANPASTTNYTLVGADANGCVNSATVTLVVLPAPTASFTMTANFLPHVWDVNATFTGGTPAYSYDWDWGDGGPHDYTAYPSHTYTTAGWYNVCATVTDANGCTGTFCQNDSLYKTSSANSMITVNVVGGTAGVKQTKNSSLSVYPNPASNYVTLNSPIEIGAFAMYNSLGELVLKGNSKDKQEKIDISKFSPGIYIVQMQGISMRLVKE